MKNQFNMCPMCGSKKIEWRNDRKWLCPDCGFDLYCNIAAAVGIVLYDDAQNVLFEVRAKDPRKGFLCLPGGFVDAKESTEDAIVRECREELGATLSEQEVSYLCSFPNIYEYKNIEYKTCDIFFAARLPASYKDMNDFVKTLHRQEREVVRFEVHRVATAEDVESLPLAFPSAKNTLLKWVNAPRHCEERSDVAIHN
ncbi:MAG: NUDIX domain-containing protein [Treponema sp.]|nr:NUDIX domain-containing protein [Treponema sp.]